MGFEIADLLRLPVIVLFDAIVSQRLEWLWQLGVTLGFIISVIGVSICIVTFTCEPSVIYNLYRLLTALGVHLVLQGWSLSTIRVIHSDYYGPKDFNHSTFSKVMDHMWNNRSLTADELDFTAKVSVCFAVLQILHWAILMILNEPFSPMAVLACTSPAWALMFNVSVTTLDAVILISEVPVLFLFSRKLEEIRPGLEHIRFPRRNANDIILDDWISALQDAWVQCRVPSVLRLFFIFRCVWGFVCLYVYGKTFTTDEPDPTTNSGLYYYFFSSEQPQPSRSQYWEDWDGIEGYFDVKNDTRHLTLPEGICAILTDSLLSSFSVGAAISVVGYYGGVALHEFVGGNDIMQGEALGMMSSILFCLLAIQTGLSSLPPWKRIVRLYRNSFLLLSAILHFCLDVVHPVLMTISPQSHIAFRKHINPLLVCFLLLVIPSGMCYWLITTKRLSSWMIALTAFNLELVVKVISTLMVYALYVTDSRSRANGIVNIDEYVFWIRSISHVIEFVCGLAMFVNGAYILMFESSNWLRAIMMTMHAYVNIYRTFREGVKTLNNRRYVNNKISSLVLVNVDDIDEQDRDVCSICYQDLNKENGEVRKTRCNHMFHFQCLRKWIFVQDTCPMCDRALFNNDSRHLNKRD